MHLYTKIYLAPIVCCLQFKAKVNTSYQSSTAMMCVHYYTIAMITESVSNRYASCCVYYTRNMHIHRECLVHVSIIGGRDLMQ